MAGAPGFPGGLLASHLLEAVAPGRPVFGDMGICGAAPINGDLDVEGAVLFAPTSPDTSLLALRMASVDAHRMPPIATLQVDDDGLAVVRDWITETAGCE